MEQKSSKYDYSTGSPEDRVKIQLPWLHPQLFFLNLFIIKMLTGDFPGNPLFKTLRFHCRGYGLDPWLGNWDLPCHRVWPKIFFLNCEYLCPEIETLEYQMSSAFVMPLMCLLEKLGCHPSLTWWVASLWHYFTCPSISRISWKLAFIAEEFMRCRSQRF